jgi:phenylpropionate dioxygenase-like ring-hydroxylating dioxygenase large terminal subunit
MLINNWYVAAESTALEGDKPLGVKMLGADFVLFRDGDGAIRCLSAVCCHRGASLAHGKIVDGQVACPYHGWRFNGEGACTLIPALGADAQIPNRARVDSYPVREKFGWIWVFLGDADERECPPFPEDDIYPEYTRDGWRALHINFEVPVNWERTEENSIDGAHPSFVHKAFGARNDPTLHIVPIEQWEWGASTTRKRTPPPRSSKTGAMAAITAENRGQNIATTAFFLCGIVNRTDIKRADGPHQVQLAARTPIDEYNTRVFLIQARDYLLEEHHDEERLAGIRQARDEDLGVVSTVKPPLTPKSNAHDLLTVADQLETTFRKRVRGLTEKGWRIDSDTVERESKRQVFVIPSVKRRDDPKNWVHKPVPLVQPAKLDALEVFMPEPKPAASAEKKPDAAD